MLEQMMDKWNTAERAKAAGVWPTAEVEKARRDVVRELVLGLMRGNAAELKWGYSAGAAMLAAVNLLPGLDENEARQLCTPVLGQDNLGAFLRYLRDAVTGEARTMIDAVENPERYWEQFMDSLVAAEPGANPAPTNPAVLA